ncbi:MAG: glycosyltransferase family 4 protein [Deltaproteobacteria bacterium]|nr:glycosyltransferase family 4 protein [Deltaproteobacteria bacterium]
MQTTVCRSSPRKIALVGNHLPRKCGIATFTTDLLDALAAEGPDMECWAVVMNDVPEGYPYPAQVRFELNHKVLSDYRLAADFLNMNQIDVVCLQHEFGIFGGENGSHILELLTSLRMPVVTTLHTVLQNPSRGQSAVLKRIAQLSDRMIVMSDRGKQILREVYGIHEDKLLKIHHGIPDVPFVDPNYYKDQFGVEGRKVILTFGLLSPGKGIEYMIDALPHVVEQHPEVVYIVLGATHPHVKKEQGEAYRFSLQQRARELRVDQHLLFHNRFVDLKELCEFLGAADIYVTPYLNREQIVSGTLAYALGTGKATISTPYWYAEEMLGDGRGRIVPFEDAEALAAQVNDLFAYEVERHAMRKRAYTYCRQMVWKEVARKYLEVFTHVKQERESRPRAVFKTKTMEAMPREMPQPKLDHIIRLTDDVGILQHAKFMVPDRYHGYCTDDNARALIAVLMAQDIIHDHETITNLACTYISFLHHAFNERTGRFRNFMGYDRRWVEQEGSQDSHGRAIWGLGEGIALSRSDHLTGAALSVFEKALPALLQFTAPRAWAFGLVGIHAYLRKFSGDSEVRRVREKLANRLFALYQDCATDDWPWMENTLTYANGKISQALILSGQWLQRGDMLDAGLHSLAWLMHIQTDPKGHFVPVGNHGWYPRGGERARFDQQPIEALGMIEACREAYNVTRDDKWISHAQRCLDWFLGRNDLQTPLYDYLTGGCCDGLNADGSNRNQGAESTLAWILSLLHLYQLRSMQVSAGAPENIDLETSEKGTVRAGDSGTGILHFRGRTNV